ncbi:MAG: class I SAM-dependent methyltransferase [Dehalococcoidia bacterium]
MTTPAEPRRRSAERPDYVPASYWRAAAQSLDASRRSSLTAVIYTGAPNWHNRLVDRDQRRAVDWALRRGGLLRDARALDIGAGSGRWSARLARRSARVVSLDLTLPMLQYGRRSGAIETPVSGSAAQLPFRSASFDLVLSVTVLQHIPAVDQAQAVAELARVCRPGGTAVLVELIDAADPSVIVFPRPVAWWRDEFAGHGLKLVALGGQEFQPLARSLRSLRQRLGHDWRAPAPVSHRASMARGRRPLISRGIALINGVSYVLEPALAAVLPARWARHGVFVFRKADSVA